MWQSAFLFGKQDDLYFNLIWHLQSSWWCVTALFLWTNTKNRHTSEAVSSSGPLFFLLEEFIEFCYLLYLQDFFSNFGVNWKILLSYYQRVVRATLDTVWLMHGDCVSLTHLHQRTMMKMFKSHVKKKFFCINCINLNVCRFIYYYICMYICASQCMLRF